MWPHDLKCWNQSTGENASQINCQVLCVVGVPDYIHCPKWGRALLGEPVSLLDSINFTCLWMLNWSEVSAYVGYVEWFWLSKEWLSDPEDSLVGTNSWTEGAEPWSCAAKKAEAVAGCGHQQPHESNVSECSTHPLLRIWLRVIIILKTCSHPALLYKSRKCE